MSKRFEDRYFFSIEPFWPSDGMLPPISTPTGHISISSFQWGINSLPCVPGNGQVAIMLQGPEEFKGFCYGVMTKPNLVPLYGLPSGEFVRFSPGTFSNIFGIPANLIPQDGMRLEEILCDDQISQIKDAMATQAPQTSLLNLFSLWEENTRLYRSSQEQHLAAHIVQVVWDSRGQIRVCEMEDATTYSSRHLQNVVHRQVGMSPKQLCRQTRFQNALFLMQTHPEASLSWLAQALGYSDQAHFSNEFRSFSGMTPTQFLRKYFKKDRE